MNKKLMGLVLCVCVVGAFTLVACTNVRNPKEETLTVQTQEFVTTDIKSTEEIINKVIEETIDVNFDTETDIIGDLNSKIAFKKGKEYKRFLSNKDDSIYIKGKNIKILNKDIEYLTNSKIINGSSKREALNQARNELIIRETMYFYATESGVRVTDKEVEDFIQNQIKLSAQSEKDYKDFLKGCEMSSEEYQESLRELRLKTLTIRRFKQQLVYENNQEETDYSKLEKQYNVFVKQYVEKEGLSIN